MDLSDKALLSNSDWDPTYLSSIFDMDFHDLSELWGYGMGDSELVDVVNKVEKYCPIVEDISIEHTVLCEVVERIETE